MSSPFSTLQEFTEAKGPIYTFANNPTMITILLLICLGITIYFFYSACTIKQETKPDSTTLSALILAGCVSLSSFLLPAPQKATAAYRQEPQRSPIALIGATLTGTLWQRRRSQFSSRFSSQRRRSRR